MTTLLEQAFQAAQKLSPDLQDEIAQQLLDDIENELKWQATLSSSDVDMGVFEAMAQVAISEDESKNSKCKIQSSKLVGRQVNEDQR